MQTLPLALPPVFSGGPSEDGVGIVSVRSSAAASGAGFVLEVYFACIGVYVYGTG